MEEGWIVAPLVVHGFPALPAFLFLLALLLPILGVDWARQAWGEGQACGSGVRALSASVQASERNRLSLALERKRPVEPVARSSLLVAASIGAHRGSK